MIKWPVGHFFYWRSSCLHEKVTTEQLVSICNVKVYEIMWKRLSVLWKWNNRINVYSLTQGWTWWPASDACRFLNDKEKTTLPATPTAPRRPIYVREPLLTRAHSNFLIGRAEPANDPKRKWRIFRAFASLGKWKFNSKHYNNRIKVRLASTMRQSPHVYDRFACVEYKKKTRKTMNHEGKFGTDCLFRRRVVKQRARFVRSAWFNCFRGKSITDALAIEISFYRYWPSFAPSTVKAPTCSRLHFTRRLTRRRDAVEQWTFLFAMVRLITAFYQMDSVKNFITRNLTRALRRYTFFFVFFFS